jgi:hypothetical protein
MCLRHRAGHHVSASQGSLRQEASKGPEQESHGGTLIHSLAPADIWDNYARPLPLPGLPPSMAAHTLTSQLRAPPIWSCPQGRSCIAFVTCPWRPQGTTSAPYVILRRFPSPSRLKGRLIRLHLVLRCVKAPEEPVGWELRSWNLGLDNKPNLPSQGHPLCGGPLVPCVQFSYRCGHPSECLFTTTLPSRIQSERAVSSHVRTTHCLAFILLFIKPGEGRHIYVHTPDLIILCSIS